MKDYIDLTQLPAEKVEAMVLALSKNDFDLLRKYCDELGILYGYPMEEVVNIFSDQLLLSKKTLAKAVGQMDPESLASRVGDIEETLSSKADLSALNPIQQLVENISSDNSVINGRLDEISTNIITLSNNVSTEISTVNDKITTISTAHNNLAGNVNNLWSDLSNASSKLDTIQKGAEKNTISAIQLNGNSISPIDKTVNLTNIVVTEKLNEKLGNVSAELSSSFDEKLNLLNGTVTGANDVLNKAVTEINNTLPSKLDITVAENISGVLSSNIKSLSSEIDKNKTDFDKKLTDISISVLFNKERIDNLAATDTAISNKIDSVSSELMGFIKGKVDDLDDELKDKVSVGKYELKVENLDKKDNELADKLSDNESKIKALNSVVDTNSRELDNKISAIYITPTKSMLLPTNGVISIDVATTSIINAQISAMADVFHVTVDEFAEHFNEDLSVVSAAIDAKTDLSVFKPVAENVKQLTISASVNAANILNLSNDISSAVHHCDHLHSNAISLINCLSSSLDTERNYRETSDAKLGILIDNEIKARTEAVDKERSEREAGDKDLAQKIESVDKTLSEKYDSLRNDHNADFNNLADKIAGNYKELSESITKEAKDRVEGDNALKGLISKLEKDVDRCETIVEENKDAYERHDVQIIKLTDTTATNTANIESLTTRLKDHTEAGSKRFDEINGKLDELEVAINGDKSGGNGLADRINDAEKEIAGLTADLNTTKKQLSTLTDTSLSSIDKLNDTLYGNSANEPGLVEVVDNLIDKVLGEDGLDKRLGSAEGNIVTLNATTEKIDSKLEELSDSIKNPESGLISQVNGNTEAIAAIQKDVKQNSDDIASLNTAITENGGINDKIDDLSSKIYGEAGLDNIVQSIIDAIGGGALDPDTDDISKRLIDLEQAKLSTSNTLDGIQANITGIQTNIGDLSGKVETIISDITNEGGINDKIGDLSVKIWGEIGLNNVVNSVITAIGGEALDPATSATISERLDSLEQADIGTSGTIGGIQTTITGIQTTIGDILKTVDNINNDLSGNHSDNPDIFGVHDRIEDLENSVKTISDLDGKLAELDSKLDSDVDELQLSATAVVEKITSVSKDLDETRGWINDLSKTTNKINEAIYGDGNPLNGLDNIVADHGRRIEALENKDVDLSPIYVKLGEVENDISGLSAENESLLAAVEGALTNIDTLGDRIDDLEKNKVDLSPINVRLDNLETENAQLLNAVTVVQKSIETLNDKLDENIEAGISDIFAEAIGNLSDDNLVDDEYQIKEITTDGSTMKDVIDRLNAIITVINNVAK